MIGTIFRKEISEFFSSLTAYITISLFLLAMGLFLWVFPDSSILEYGYASLESMFRIAPWIFIFLVPAVTMRLLAEERHTGTYELLATSPLRKREILLGKFLAAVLLVACCLLPTLVYYYSVYQLGEVKGNLDSGAIAGSYIGLFLLGAAFSAIGLFASSVSSKQVVAFMLAVFLCFFAFSGFDSLSRIVSFGKIDFLLAQTGIYEHYRSLSRGVADTRDLLYFFSLTVLFLMAAGLSMEITKAGLKRALRNLLAVAAVLILANVLGFRHFTRFDLTKDKRYTLSKTTVDMLTGLEGEVVIRVFLEGDLSTDIKRLQTGVRDLLEEFKAWSKGQVFVEFTDPLASGDGDAGNAAYRTLTEAGLEPTSLNIRRTEGNLQKIIFPGALVQYRGKQLPVNFLGTHYQTQSAAESINASVQNLEYLFSSAIHKLIREERTPIAFLTGHGEAGGRKLIDITGTLSRSYDVKQVSLEGTPLDELAGYRALIIAKPLQPFTEAEKYKLDQYLMHGGNLFLLADRFNANLDSMRTRGNMLALPLELNLDDLLFRYGARINYDLIRDLNCAPIPVVMQAGSQGGQQLMPWVYFPLVLPHSPHPIVRNIDPLRMKFASSIDTLGVQGVRKTILLSSSPYTQKAGAPVYLSLESISETPDPSAFNAGSAPLAVLLEGNFPSAFTNRIREEFDQSLPFLATGRPARIILVSDGDVIENEISALDNSYFPLGYDKYTRQTFGNKTFVQNSVDYLAGEDGLLSLRSREVSIRMLDRQRAATEKTAWQVLNIAGPQGLLLLFALANHFLRKRKYAR